MTHPAKLRDMSDQRLAVNGIGQDGWQNATPEGHFQSHCRAMASAPEYSEK